MSFIYEHAPSAGLIFFFCVFLWVAFQAYRPSAKQKLQDYGNIPLKEDSND
jgi:cbb3-type cytochrome oxidase subunit 3